MRRVGGVVVGAAVAVAMLTGCSSETGGEDKKGGKRDVKAGATAKEAAPARTLGDKGTACELPVRFELEKSWKPKAVDMPADKELAALGQQGPVTLVCEIDAKPAGHIGFLRVWTGTKGAAAKGGTPTALLKAFMADSDDSPSGVKYREIKAGDLPAAEVTYTAKALDDTKRERALAVMTPQGGLVLHLGGLDTDEHEAMLPAYERAKRTMAYGA
ncbi:lipoprotein [Streptomyces sp. NPDC005322]|uniref:lipoprotein n=1 Tax=Streptomyces sp. NPDC005322 TaxID=3157032 RepID=UPI0033AE77B3